NEGYERQIAALRELTERDPDDAESRRLLGLVLGLNGDVAGQERALEESVQHAPADAASYKYLGIAETLAGNYAEAEAALDNAARLGANPGDTAAARGFLASRAERALTAVAQFEEAAANGSSIDLFAKCRLGLLYM